jgi:hypothetical protein
MNEAIKEALKELGRLIVLAVVPILIATLEAKEFDWKALLVLVAIAALRVIDKYLHEKDMMLPVRKQSEGTLLKGGGLTGF